MNIKRIIKNHTLIYPLYRKVKDLSVMIPQAIKQANEQTYYEEYQQKSHMQKIKDNLIWVMKNKEVNRFYTLYGLDTVEGGKDIDKYCPYKYFMRTRNVINNVGKTYSQTGILRDKYIFYKYMDGLNIPVPEVFAVIRNGVVYDAELNVCEDTYLEAFKDYFVKEIEGECASYVKHIDDFSDYLKIKEELKDKVCIAQKRLVQCEALNQLNAGALNTIRMVTINKNGETYVFSTEIRVGTKNTGHVDNAAAGGICIGVNEDGTLKKYGLAKYGEVKRITAHPDTKVVFEGFQIPHYQKAVEMACKAHKMFYHIGAIGWDIGISEEGPMFVEGNDNWEISGLQSCNGGLKEEWLKVIK